MQRSYPGSLLLKHGPRAGQVLVFEGVSSPGNVPLRSAELFDPIAGTWTPTGDPLYAAERPPNRDNYPMTELLDGRVLVGGAALEVWDPSDGSWSPPTYDGDGAANMITLSDGRVLMIGANKIVDFDNGTEVAAPPVPPWVRAGAKAVSLPDGRVLLVTGSGTLRSTVYTPGNPDPGAGTWSDTPDGVLQYVRSNLFSVNVLSDGSVLVAGGVLSGGQYATTLHPERWDPTSGLWTETPDMSGTLTIAVAPVGAASALVVGEFAHPVVYDATTDTVTTLPSMPRAWRRLQPLASGAVLALEYRGPTGAFTLDPVRYSSPTPGPAAPPCSSLRADGVTTYTALSCFASDTGISVPQYTFEGLVALGGSNCFSEQNFADPLDLGGVVVRQTPCVMVSRHTRSDGSFVYGAYLWSSARPSDNIGERNASISLPPGTTSVLLQVIDGQAELPTQMEVTRADGSTHVIDVTGPITGQSDDFAFQYVGAADPAGITRIRPLGWAIEVSGVLAAPAPVPSDVTATVAANASLVTPPPTPASPVGVGVRTPDGGDVSVAFLGSTSVPAPSGFNILGQDIVITAPDALNGPLDLTLRIDSSAIPNGTDRAAITVMRDGTPLANCPGTSPRNESQSWPCVVARTDLTDGDLLLEIYTEHASTWTSSAQP